MMQSTNFVSSDGEGRNPFYEGQFDGETPEQAAYRLHWSRATRESERANTRHIEVDRDIKAANLQLLVGKVLDYKEAAESAVGGPGHIDTYEAERLLDDTVALARSLKQ